MEQDPSAGLAAIAEPAEVGPPVLAEGVLGARALAEVTPHLVAR